MKLTDMIEGWNDPPEYDDPSSVNFSDSDLDSVKDQFTLLGYDKYNYKTKSGSDIVVVMNKDTRKGYMFHSDNVGDEYYVGDYYVEYDEDEDGRYSYETIDEDSLRLEDESFTVFATVSYEANDVAQTIDEYESGAALLAINKKSLADINMNYPEWYPIIINLISSPRK